MDTNANNSIIRPKQNPEKKLLSASDAANSSGVNHIVFVLSDNGEIVVNGSEGIVGSIVGDPSLFSIIESKVKENASTSEINTSLKVVYLGTNRIQIM